MMRMGRLASSRAPSPEPEPEPTRPRDDRTARIARRLADQSAKPSATTERPIVQPSSAQIRETKRRKISDE